jgi:hypothetical protein
MPRPSRKSPEEIKEQIVSRVAITLPPEMREFLDMEAKRLRESGRKGKVTPATIVRALITAYYEKRLAGLVTSPDD